MYAEYCLVHNTTNGHVVENLAKTSPQVNAVSALYIIVKSVHTGHGCTLVVASKQEYMFRIFDFEKEQEGYGLQAMRPSINVAAQEQITAGWWKPTELKPAKQVMKLPIDIPQNFQRSL